MDIKITVKQTKNSILGSSQIKQIEPQGLNGTDNFKYDESADLLMFSEKRDDDLKSNDGEGGTKTRDHLKRKAKEMRNSKYDESFLVDYSGPRSKNRNGDLEINP